MIKKTSAIITAAGHGRRMGKGRKKQFLMLGENPVIVYTLQTFEKSDSINEIILVVPDDGIDYCKQEIVNSYKFTKVKKIVTGGEKRQESVFNGLKSVSREMDLVAVHDGVRPFLSKSILENSIKKAKEKGSVVVAIPVKDTLMKISDQGMVVGGQNRDSIWRIQTPQIFKKEILISAFEKALKDNFCGTDESTLVARLGIPVYVVNGSELNIKITTPEDIDLGESIMMAQSKKQDGTRKS
ncbi:MAG TPA: 2-C-methyl-D-erythritol 4-phosphate cytidylyltransferase [Nitrospinota bacterium]|jgi:2-C-methyl-D-erythritol 4-phosphate cytidylyltransferase|nr:2-C-methyl-D-erythritol 4-phosphate cytidylyltransferase [Nitrospinota bacterium]